MDENQYLNEWEKFLIITIVILNFFIKSQSIEELYYKLINEIQDKFKKKKFVKLIDLVYQKLIFLKYLLNY